MQKVIRGHSTLANDRPHISGAWHWSLKTIASNPNHFLYQILPLFRPSPYSLRKRGHSFQCPIIDTTLLKSSFIDRCLSVCIIPSLPPSLLLQFSLHGPFSVCCSSEVMRPLSCFILHASYFSRIMYFHVLLLLHVSVVHVTLYVQFS